MAVWLSCRACFCSVCCSSVCCSSVNNVVCSSAVCSRAAAWCAAWLCRCTRPLPSARSSSSLRCWKQTWRAGPRLQAVHLPHRGLRHDAACLPLLAASPVLCHLFIMQGRASLCTFLIEGCDMMRLAAELDRRHIAIRWVCSWCAPCCRVAAGPACWLGQAPPAADCSLECRWLSAADVLKELSAHHRPRPAAPNLAVLASTVPSLCTQTTSR